MADNEVYRSNESASASDAWTSSEEVSDADLLARDALRAGIRLGLGVAGLALAAIHDLLELSNRPAGTASMVANERSSVLPRPSESLWRIAVAAGGLGVETQRRCLDAAATVGGPVATVMSAVVVTASARGPVAMMGRALGLRSEQGLAEQRRNQEVALASGRAVVRAVVAAVLAEVDLDAVVARIDLDRLIDRLDFDHVIGRIDLDAIAARLDLDAVAARIDLDRLIDRLDFDHVIGRIDLDAIAARLDLDAVAAQLDVNAVVDRVDLARVTEQVLDEVDLGNIVRESSGVMAAETVDAVRISGMRADRFLSKVIDRFLLRAGGRDTGPKWVPQPVAANEP